MANGKIVFKLWKTFSSYLIRGANGVMICTVTPCVNAECTHHLNFGFITLAQSLLPLG
jgi:hypothetical protein